MTNKSYVIIVFRSRQHALNFADILKENGIPALLTATPKELSSGCGFSVRFENGFLNEVTILKDKIKPESSGMYRIITKNNTAKYEKLD